MKDFKLKIILILPCAIVSIIFLTLFEKTSKGIYLLLCFIILLIPYLIYGIINENRKEERLERMLRNIRKNTGNPDKNDD